MSIRDLLASAHLAIGFVFLLSSITIVFFVIGRRSGEQFKRWDVVIALFAAAVMGFAGYIGGKPEFGIYMVVALTTYSVHLLLQRHIAPSWHDIAQPTKWTLRFFGFSWVISSILSLPQHIFGEVSDTIAVSLDGLLVSVGWICLTCGVTLSPVDTQQYPGKLIRFFGFMWYTFLLVISLGWRVYTTNPSPLILFLILYLLEHAYNTRGMGTTIR